MSLVADSHDAFGYWRGFGFTVAVTIQASDVMDPFILALKFDEPATMDTAHMALGMIEYSHAGFSLAICMAPIGIHWMSTYHGLISLPSRSSLRGYSHVGQPSGNGVPDA